MTLRSCVDDGAQAVPRTSDRLRMRDLRWDPNVITVSRLSTAVLRAAAGERFQSLDSRSLDIPFRSYHAIMGAYDMRYTLQLIGLQLPAQVRSRIRRVSRKCGRSRLRHGSLHMSRVVAHLRSWCITLAMISCVSRETGYVGADHTTAFQLSGTR